MQNRFQAITYLKCLAALAVFNTHLDNIYPPPVKFIAHGGFYANCLFFFISGFCLTNLRFKFLSWYWRRLIRVGVPFLVLTPFLIFSVKPLNYENAYHAVFSRSYHFILELLILYIFYYFVVKWNGVFRYGLAVTTTFTLLLWALYYFTIYDPSIGAQKALSPNAFFAYFISMIMGAMVREKTCERTFNRSKRHIVTLAVAAVLFCGAYVVVLGAKISGRMEGLLFPAVLGFLYFSTEFALSFNAKLPRIAFVEQTANLSLELYIVQNLLLRAFRELGFPTNLVYSLISVFAVARILQYASNCIIAKIPAPSSPQTSA